MDIIEKIKTYDIPVVVSHGRYTSAEALLEFTRPLEGIEGFVVDFDGHKVKVKADQYVTLHRVKDQIRTERHILEIIINGKLDDVLPILDATDRVTVEEYQQRFNVGFDAVVSRIEGLVLLARALHSGDKKEVAIKFVPNLLHKEDSSFIFRVLDGKELRPHIIEYVRKSVGNTTRYDALLKWLQM